MIDTTKLHADRISIVIPTYNSSRTLLNTINSVKNQTLSPSEIIVVDDGSTDGTDLILEEKHPEITVIRRNKNMGVSVARDSGYRRAEGEYIVFLDADDILCPEFLATALRFLSKREDISAFCGDFYRTHEGEEKSVLASHCQRNFKPRFFDSATGLDFYLQHTGSLLLSFTVFRKEALERLQVDGCLFLEKLRNNQDFHFFVRFFSQNCSLFAPTPLGIYALQPTSISRDRAKVWSSRRVALESLIQQQESHSLSEVLVVRLKKMRMTSQRKLARALLKQNKRKEAINLLLDELVKFPSIKTFGQLILIASFLEHRRSEYGGVEV